MSQNLSRWDEDAFWRKLILPQEDRKTPWDGKGYRWFRSPNIIPIEQWRRRGNGNTEPGQTQLPESTALNTVPPSRSAVPGPARETRLQSRETVIQTKSWDR